MRQSAVRTLDWGMILLFSTMTVVTLIGVPLFAYYYDYTVLDWILLVVLYIMTGMGITVGYHRMISHRSFDGLEARRQPGDPKHHQTCQHINPNAYSREVDIRFNPPTDTKPCNG